MAHSIAYSSAPPSNASLNGLAAASNSCSFLSIQFAVRYKALSPTKILIAISANLYLIAQKFAIGCLNCSLVFRLPHLILLGFFLTPQMQPPLISSDQYLKY